MSRQYSGILQFCVICVLLTGNGIWAGPANSEETPGNKNSAPLAVIDGNPITRSAFQEEMKRRQGVFDAERKKELLESLVSSELVFAAARRAGYEKDPEVLRAARQAMINRYLRDKLEPKLEQVKVTDGEAEAYYGAHQAEFGDTAMVHAAIIRIAVPPRASAQAKADLRKRAQKAREEALALEPGVPGFGSVAITYSEDQASRYRGGDIDWLQAGKIDKRWDAKVLEAAFALTAAGRVSPVISAEDGYYLVKLMETKAASIRPYAEVKDGVRYRVVQEKKKNAESEFIEELKKRIPVTVNKGLLQTAAGPGEAKKMEPPKLPAR